MIQKPTVNAFFVCERMIVAELTVYPESYLVVCMGLRG